MDEMYSLKNPTVYLNANICAPNSICSHYRQIVIEYFDAAVKQQTNMLIKHNDIFKYILIRGLETITHVFVLVMHYTHNIDAACYHSQRGIILYLEFISQIHESVNNFLKMTSRDAVMYVYKKTIFLLKRELVRGEIINKTNDNTMSDTVCSDIDVYKRDISFYLQVSIADKEIRESDLESIHSILQETHVSKE